ncbi:MAG: TlyA family RNA methyltransferase [Lachnospiraceae bacterium]|nr:TlyA family RNA methyltransferase [Lachnospiraceae bacterium]
MKERLDVLLVKRGLAESREKAKALIMSGNVYVKEQREDKAGTMFADNVEITVKGSKLPYVSRGGLKLEKAIKVWKPPVEGAVCMDVGSSTGGFTDCMLQNGAKLVYAIDVGTNQLAWKLRQDPRVVSMEKTNIRYVTEDDLPQKVDFVSIDVAFISLKKVMTAVFNLMKDDAHIVCLIKPQFEAGREKVGKKGVVREPKVHVEVIEDILNYMHEMPYDILGLDYSPIKGPEGNTEYLLYMKKKSAADSNINREADEEIWNAYLEGVGELVETALGATV